jgi:hypothetical protein
MVMEKTEVSLLQQALESVALHPPPTSATSAEARATTLETKNLTNPDF